MWEILGDPAHKITNPVLYRVDEISACWQAITAKVLWVEAENTEVWRRLARNDGARAEIDRRRAMMPNPAIVVIRDAGHMLHHDQPEALAKVIEQFLD
jgi:pimeloyl-ACP methyl ester carboxylesterase